MEASNLPDAELKAFVIKMLYVESKNKMNEQIKQTQTNRHRE